MVSTERPDSFVDVLVRALGIEASRCEFLYISRERSLAVASFRGGHSSVTEVCVTLRTCGRCEDVFQMRVGYTVLRAEVVPEKHVQKSPGCPPEALKTPGRASVPPRYFGAPRY